MRDKLKNFGGKTGGNFSLPDITTKPSKIQKKDDEKKRFKIRVRTRKKA